MRQARQRIEQDEITQKMKIWGLYTEERYVYTDKLHQIVEIPHFRRILIDGKMANPYDHHILNRKQALERYPEYFL